MNCVSAYAHAYFQVKMHLCPCVRQEGAYAHLCHVQMNIPRGMKFAVGAHKDVEHLHEAHNINGIPSLRSAALVLDRLESSLQFWRDLSKEMHKESL